MDSWQVVILVFVVLLPLVLMIDFWGDERLSFRGRPIARPWIRQIEHADPSEADPH